MRLRYSPEAREDLRRASQYIAFEFQNPKAAKDLVQRIMRDCAALKRFPQMGMRLSEKIERETPLRFLICGKHISFYRIEGSEIYVTRILDGRSNYLQVLLGADDEPLDWNP